MLSALTGHVSCLVVHREPEDAAILKELNAVKRTKKAEAKESAKLYKGSLGPRPKAVPGQSASEAFADEIAKEKGKAEAAAAGGEKAGGSSRKGVVSSGGGGAGFVGKVVAFLMGLIQWLLQLLHLSPRAVAAAPAQPVSQ